MYVSDDNWDTLEYLRQQYGLRSRSAVIAYLLKEHIVKSKPVERAAAPKPNVDDMRSLYNLSKNKPR